MIINPSQPQWLVITATTNSEWDKVDFCLLRLSQRTIDFIKSRCNLDSSDPHLLAMLYSFYDFNFYRNRGYFDESLLMERPFFKCSEEEDIISTWEKPESGLYGSILNVLRSGYISFSSFGKHSGEEFMSGSIDFCKVFE